MTRLSSQDVGLQDTVATIRYYSVPQEEETMTDLGVEDQESSRKLGRFWSALP